MEAKRQQTLYNSSMVEEQKRRQAEKKVQKVEQRAVGLIPFPFDALQPVHSRRIGLRDRSKEIRRRLSDVSFSLARPALLRLP